MKTFLAVFSIVFGAISLPLVWALATNRLDITSKREKKLYKAEGRKIANKINSIFLTLLSVTAIAFGLLLFFDRIDTLEYIIPLLIIEALGPVGVVFYMNAKWRKK